MAKPEISSFDSYSNGDSEVLTVSAQGSSLGGELRDVFRKGDELAGFDGVIKANH